MQRESRAFGHLRRVLHIPRAVVVTIACHPCHTCQTHQHLDVVSRRLIRLILTAIVEGDVKVIVDEDVRMDPIPTATAEQHPGGGVLDRVAAGKTRPRVRVDGERCVCVCVCAVTAPSTCQGADLVFHYVSNSVHSGHVRAHGGRRRGVGG